MKQFSLGGSVNSNSDGNTEPKQDDPSEPVSRFNKLIKIVEDEHRTISNDSPVKDKTYKFLRRNMGRSDYTGFDNVTSTRGRFKSSFSDEDRHYFYTRDELLHKLIDKWWSTVFHKNWMDMIASPDAENVEDAEQFVKACAKLHEEINIQKNFQLAGRLGGLQGISYIGISYGSEDGSEDGTAARLRAPKNAESIRCLTPLRKGLVSWDKNDIDTDTSSDNFGKPKYFKLKRRNLAGHMETELIHYSRILPIVPFPFDDHWEGMNQIDHLGDMLLSKKDMDWTSAETARRGVIPFTHIQYPNDEDARDYVDKNFADGIEGKDVFSHPYEEDEQWKIDFVEAKNNFPFHEHYDSKVKLISGSASVPTVIALGTGVGTTSGSQVNVDSFYSDISSHQRNNWTPIIRELNKRALEAGVLKKYGYEKDTLPNYLINWNPPYELTGEQLARRNRLDAIAYGELTDKGVISINDARRKCSMAPSEEPMAEMLLYKGIPLEDWPYLFMKQLSPRMIEELRKIDAYTEPVDLEAMAKAEEEPDEEGEEDDKPNSELEEDNDKPDPKEQDNNVVLSDWEVD